MTSGEILVQLRERQAPVLEALARKIYERGGGPSSVSVFTPSEGDETIAQLADAIVGGIRKLIGVTFELDVDFDSSPQDFDAVHQYPTEPAALESANRWPQSRPKEPCRYAIVHFGECTVQEVLGEHEPAGSRELRAFVQNFARNADIRSCFILALGSMKKTKEEAKTIIEVPACTFGPDGQYHVMAHPICGPEETRLCSQFFYLVRQYANES